MEETLKQIAIQVPSTALVVYFSLQVVKIVLDKQGQKLEKLTDAIERLTDKIK